jgi:hypothetical protein
MIKNHRILAAQLCWLCLVHDDCLGKGRPTPQLTPASIDSVRAAASIHLRPW